MNTPAKYIATIGLEVHAELATKSKMFCSCKNDPDEERPNVNICPVCMGHPGTLPVLNKEAIKHVLKVGLSVGGKLADFTEWDRKNYFYPDIPKGYQISQYAYPLVTGGKLAGVDLTRIHLEEDTAQSTHDQHEKSLVNFNRAGVPLMELVTEPVIHDAETAVRFAKELQLLLRYLGAGEANLEKGEMRVEANISVASPEDTAARKFGTKTEVKNLNSFRSVERAIAFEIERHTRILEAISAGNSTEKIVQETRGWDDGAQKTFSQRAKESAHDYRYFPDPDLPKMKLSEMPEFSANVLEKEIRATAGELPWERRARYKTDYEMTDKEVAVFVDTPRLANYFQAVVSNFSNDVGGASSAVSDVRDDASEKNKKLARLAINYLLTDYLGLMKKEFGEDLELGLEKRPIAAEIFAKLIGLIALGTLSSRGGKDLLAELYISNSDKSIDLEALAKKKGFIQKSDENELKEIAKTIIRANPQVVAEFKAGKMALLQFFIGQGMKASKGSANPEVLKKIFTEALS